ncbi:MAG: 3-deoxy-D-manno-octulosonic acid transferase, partial [Kiritimatiellae bacterium]|nr:3-deoxy-D-manno-octulosonic acid transferase [Kiritimatiellia bacterium]
MLKRALYNLLFAAVYPFLLPGFLLRMLRRGGYAARLGDRFALYPAAVRRKLSEGGFVWVHAVSVGEVQVAGQLMREWRGAEPSVRFLFSTTSSTGWRVAEREVTARDVLVYNPLDFPNFVKSALDTVRPRAVVLTESEIWPNFIWAARRRGVPLFLVNARVSDRSAPRYKAARWFFGDVLSSFTRIFAQSALDAGRLVAAGAPSEIVETTGSFKFDVARRDEAKEREMRAWVGPGRILLGGSTWPGEDEALLRIYSSLAPGDLKPPLKLVIAPRHFEKADAVEANVRAAGFSCVRRSRGASPAREGDGGTEVYLADTTGELMGLYGIADVVFVGKSLCAHGSQNMIEPCLCGKPTAVGPNTENFRPVMSDLLAADAIVQAPDERALAAFVRRA